MMSAEHRARNLLALNLLGVASLALYIARFLRPYFILDYISTPFLDLAVISGRQLNAALAFVGGFLALFLLYALALFISRNTRTGLAATLVLLWGVVFSVPLFLTYPVSANDIFGYAAHGEIITRFDANPLVFPASEFPDARLAIYSGFREQVSNYGPLWTWVEAGVVSAFGAVNVLWPVLGFKLVALGAYLLTAVLIYAILRRRMPEQAVAGLLFFAWNPLVLFEYAVNGHNDALMAALVLAGVWFWQVRRPLWMTLSLTLALLVKIPAALLLPIFLLSAARRQDSRGDRQFVAVAGSLLIVMLVGVAYLSLPQGAQGLKFLLERADLFTHSLPTLIRQLLLPLLGDRSANAIARNGALLALGMCFIVQLGRTWIRSDNAIRYAYELWLVLLLFVTLWFQPWYVTWLVPLAALFPCSDTCVQTGLFSLTVTWSYVVGGFIWLWAPQLTGWRAGLGSLLLFIGTSYGLPWLYFLLSHWPGRHRRAFVVKSPAD
jgi:alpha-1,6-mannosyltransferase